MRCALSFVLVGLCLAPLACVTEEPVEVVAGGSDERGDEWVSLAECPETLMIRGNQGLQHIWVSARARGINPKSVITAASLYHADTGALVEPGHADWTVNYKPIGESWTDGQGSNARTYAGGPWYQYAAVAAVVLEPCAVVGKKLRVKVRIKDPDGRVGVGEGCAIAAWDWPCDP